AVGRPAGCGGAHRGPPVMTRTLALAVLLSCATARAEGMYLSEPQLLAKLFPDAPQAVGEEAVLTDAEAAEVEWQLGYRLDGRRYRGYAVSDAAGYRGQVLLLDVLGQSAPIT